MKRGLLSVGVLLMLVSCAPYRVQTDFDHAIKFTQYKAFSWSRDFQRRRSDRFRFREGSLNEHRVMQAVTSQLSRRGLRQVPPSRADLIVSYKVVIHEKLVVDHYPGWYRPYWAGHSAVHTYREGTLIIEMVDAKRRRLVWRGWASGRLGRPDTTAADINLAVTSILNQFPPGRIVTR